MHWMIWTIWVVAALAGAVGAGVLWSGLGPRRQILPAWRVPIALGLGLFVATIPLVGGLAVSVVVTRSLFAAMHVLFAWLAVVPALMGVVLLWQAAPRVRGAGRGMVVAGGLVGLLCPVVAGYATLIEPTWLTLRRVEVPIAAEAPAPVRIVVLADIQTDRIGAHERRAVEMALAERPDIILLAGDYVDTWAGDRAALREEMAELLKRLRAAGGVYACVGNIDEPRATAELMQAAGVRLLYNDVDVTTVGGTRVAIGGTEWRCESEAAQGAIERLAATDADARVLLAHTPDAVLTLRADAGIDLVVSGHTHGGQVQVPGLGPLVTFSAVPRRVGGGGMHEVGGQRIYVSRGVGHERKLAPRIRFWCRPEVGVVMLVPRNDR